MAHRPAFSLASWSWSSWPEVVLVVSWVHGVSVACWVVLVRALGVAVVAVVVAGVAICWVHVHVVVAGGVAVVWVHVMIGAGQTGGRTEEGAGEFAAGSENGKKTVWVP